MKKVGLLLGCFNPVHNGHIDFAKRALRCEEVDEVWFVPSLSNLNPKDSILIPSEYRKNMLELALTKEEDMKVCDIELMQDRQLFTYETLALLRNTYDYKFSLLIATDNLKGLEAWREYQSILDNHSIIVAKRDKSNINKIINDSEVLKQYRNKIIVINSEPKYEISSTMIRNNILDKDHMLKYLDSQVYRYIEENQLYRRNENEKI